MKKLLLFLSASILIGCGGKETSSSLNSSKSSTVSSESVALSSLDGGDTSFVSMTDSEKEQSQSGVDSEKSGVIDFPPIN